MTTPSSPRAGEAEGGVRAERWEPAVHAAWALARSLADAGQDAEAADAVLAYLEQDRGVTIAVNAVERDYWLAALASPEPDEEPT